MNRMLPKLRVVIASMAGAILIWGCGATKEPLAEETWTQMEKLADSRNIEFVTGNIEPLGNVQTTSANNYLRIQGDSVHMALPYAGSSSVAKFGNDRGGLRFSSIATRIKTSRNEKQNSLDLSFSTRNKSESFQCNLKIFSGGRATLGINSSQRSFIQYEGLIRLLPD